MSSCLLAASCGRRHDGSPPSLAEANAAALEQSIDMDSHSADSDGKLRFDRTAIRLGDVALGQTRTLEVSATNLTGDPIVILDVATSCGCTRVEYDRKPVPAGGIAKFTVKYSAETEGAFFKKIAVRHSASRRPVSFTIEGAVINSSKSLR